ncbi:MAG: hypothetical protein HGA65_00820, partial [Oscillochloris sp.]|nr:hypothetical protein [Oscillochloris sp.]
MTARPALGRLPSVLRIVLAGLAGALLVALLGQISSRHTVDIGRYDAAYVQGFYEAEHSSDSAGPGAYLDGADGAVRWSYPAGSALLFPQVGLPGTLHLRLRAWRPDGNLPRITLLLNGGEVLADVQASGDWQDLSVELRSGMAKPIDFFVELRVSSSLTLADDRSVGVLLDALTYEVTGLPVLPYPAQLFYAALVGAMLWLLLGEGQSRGFWPPVVGLGLYGIAWLLLYHCQPPLYPYPLRMLPPLVCLGLAALLLLRDGPGLVSRAPALLCRLAPLALISGWAAATLLAAQSHVTLARPGVENDFRVFATRETLDQVLGADSFYNLGYPLLLWLVRPLFAGNAFLAGRLVAVLCGALFLAGGYWLARAMLPPGPALLALLLLALSGFVAQYGLYLGSDMPLAACVSLCVAAFVAGGRQPPAPSPLTQRLFLLAGVFGGLAFLMRHLGLVLLPWGLLVLLLRGRAGHRPALLFAAGFLLMAAPQLLINLAQTGSPLYNQQAKNVWLAVYANTDWGRWGEVPNSISLAEIVLRDPARFLANWWHNVVAFLGSGAEDTSEFGRADQLRLLGWPANWLAVGGLGWWAVRSAGGRDRARLPSPAALLLLILIYAL